MRPLAAATALRRAGLAVLLLSLPPRALPQGERAQGSPPATLYPPPVPADPEPVDGAPYPVPPEERDEAAPADGAKAPPGRAAEPGPAAAPAAASDPVPPSAAPAAEARPASDPVPPSAAPAAEARPASSPSSVPPAGAALPPTPSAAERERAEREAAERALERALVQRGGLVVRQWGIEIVPELSFAHADRSGGGLLGARSEVLTGALTLRVGLPFDLQVEGTAPFVASRLTPGDDPQAPAAEGYGLGDVQLGATWHALRGRARLPDVLLGGFWKSRSGETAFDDPDVRVPLGTGIEQFGGTLALVKAVDPMVLLVTATYAVAAPRWIPEGWLEAGDTVGGSAGAVLAVSPETSLSFALEAEHARPLRLDGATIYRSDRTSAVFRVGVATMASRRGFLQVNLGMGLTSDVPQFEVSVATPIQF